MTILLVSDLHSSRQALLGLDKLLELERFDLTLCAGDVTDRHDRRALEYLEDFIDLITRKHQTPLKMVFGNNESQEVIAAARNRQVLLHFEEVTFDSHRVAGIGDVDSQPDVPGGQLTDVSGTILVSHRPTHLFKQIKQRAQFTNAPAIQIFGHLHNRAETWQLGETLVIQVPAALLGRYATLTLPDKKVAFKWFKDF